MTSWKVRRPRVHRRATCGGSPQIRVKRVQCIPRPRKCAGLHESRGQDSSAGAPLPRASGSRLENGARLSQIAGVQPLGARRDYLTQLVARAPCLRAACMTMDAEERAELAPDRALASRDVERRRERVLRLRGVTRMEDLAAQPVELRLDAPLIGLLDPLELAVDLFERPLLVAHPPAIADEHQYVERRPPSI